ncbi:hypothetical protein E3J79_01900 [Candidatus Dependentiae bacterium]|nr:MAG: hypothetical protein E3J79_01900 [Candidatus Dependentiae bacterium]
MKQITKKFLYLLFTSILFLQHHLKPADKVIQNLHRYIWANYNHAGGKFNEAQKWYDAIFLSNQSSIHTYKGYIHLLRDIGKFQQIVNLIPKLESNTAITDDPGIQLIFIQSLEKTGRINEATNRLITANNKYKGDQEIAFHTANLYLRRKEPKNALIVIDNFLSNCPHKPNNFIFYFLKSQILVNLNQKEKAVEQIKKCLEIHPNFDKGWLFYALLEEQQGNLGEAIKAFTTYLNLSGGNKEVEQHLLQLILKQRTLSQQNKSINIEADVFKHTKLLFEQKRYHEALEQLQHYLNQNSHNSKIHNQIKINYRSDEYKKSLAMVKQILQKIDYIDKKQMFNQAITKIWKS